MKSVFYLKRNPFPEIATKPGITSHPAVRLGTYQNSFYHGSHMAAFDVVWIGERSYISKLERRILEKYNWNIEKDGRGFSEWVGGVSVEDMEVAVQNIIDTHFYHITKVDKALGPFTLNNIEILERLCNEE